MSRFLPLRLLRLKFIGFALVASALSAISTADDTDIFLGNGQYQEGTLPNVLFVIDNSGSMDQPAKNADGALTGQTRMQALKTAFNDLMQNIQGVNVGVMRFNTPGGSVLYPVTNIDSLLPLTPKQTQSDMLLSADDAVELVSTGAVNLSDDTLKLGFTTSASTTTYSVTTHVAAQEDDREESISTGAKIDGSRMDMNASQLCGLRYLNMNIPKGAIIQSAYLEMTAPVDATGETTIQIRGQNADNPAIFSGSNYDLANRLSNQPTAAFVNWFVPSSQPWTIGNRYNSADISSIVQELVNQPSWDNNDAMVLFFDHQTGTSRSGSLMRDDTAATQGATGTNTKLHITYTLTAPADANLVGLRFEDVSIPQGATITNAYLRFDSAIAHSTVDNLELKIRAESSDNAPAFSNSSFGLSARSKTLTEVAWSPESEWPLDSSVTGPDITTLVQQVVNRSGWCGNNAMAFYIQPSTTSPLGGSRHAYSYDEVSHRHPELVVNYTTNGGGCMNTLWSKRPLLNEDDASENNNSTKTVTNSATSLTLGNSQKLGLRFQNLPFARNATVMEAYLEFTASTNSSGNLHVDLYAHNTNNSAAFPNSDANISNRVKTTATTRWNISENWSTDLTYRSPDIKALIQEVLNRGSWTEGNALSLLVYGNSSSISTRNIFSFDGSGARAAKLVVKVASTPTVSAPDLTVRQHINNLVQNLTARTYTPIVDTLYESALYFRGAPVYYGADRQLFNSGDNIDMRYKRVSVNNSYKGGTHVLPAGCSETNLDSTNCRDETITSSPTAPLYISPIVKDCQSNHLVLFTDGEANHNNSRTLIGNMIGDSNCSADSTNANEQCGRSLTKWMANNDMQPSLSTTNIINTHTIAFNLSNTGALTFLRDMATQGKGNAYTANTSAELEDAFNAIIRNIVSRDSTFTAPGATVNQFNRLSNRSEIYFSVFKPEATPRWAGNLKRYKLLGNPAVISDANDQAAVDETTGFFKASAKSVWSSNTDGASVELGGAAKRLVDDPASRKLYTHLPAAASNPASLSLTAAANQFSYLNTDITTEMLQATDAAERNNILKWAMGYDIHDTNNNTSVTDARKQLGDPLHSIPLLITYSGPADTPDITAFFGTNEGFLHAIDADTGNEVFSFMPQHLLGNLKTLYDNNKVFNHPYGMDGSPVAWVQDLDYDNKVNDNDKVYLYMGMRSGGRNLYAFDVTNRAQPKMLWTIEGGSGDFTSLGYTWSRPIKSKVKIEGVVKDVLLFAGGFDPIIDANPANRVFANMGNAIYMVDANTGERLWMAGNSVTAGQGLNLNLMKYAITADLSLLDINKDGLADMLFVGDTGGQVWRFDFHHGANTSNLATGGMIAELADNTQLNDRRFHFKPDVSIFGDQGNLRMAVSIASGSIQEPLEQTTLNRFYVIFQDDIYSAPATYTKLTETNLTDRTDDITNTRVTNSGWYITLENTGEKTLASSLTVNNQVIFTTYAPETAASACSGVTGTGRVYLVNLTNGSPKHDLNNTDTITKEDRSRVLKAPSIPPTPKMLFPEQTDVPTVLVGPEQPLIDIDLGVKKGFERTFWYEPTGSTY